jgi:preprotein translocase subunit SecA
LSGLIGADVSQLLAAQDAQDNTVTDSDGVTRIADEEAFDAAPQVPLVKTDNEKLGRNELCWCGSGKKFKACHGK